MDHHSNAFRKVLSGKQKRMYDINYSTIFNNNKSYEEIREKQRNKTRVRKFRKKGND